jgi:O-methyltransferase
MIRRIINIPNDVLKAIRSKNILTRFNVLRKAGRWILPRYRFKWPQVDWWEDEAFNEYLKRFDELDGMNTDRRWMTYQLTRLTAFVPGDTAECGVFQGAGSYLICRTNVQNTIYRRTHFLFDSFEGLSQPTILDGGHWKKGDLACGEDVVRENLSQFNNISFHKGWIPDRFLDVRDNRFAFVHIDVDLAQPTFDSMQFFYPRMNDGGIILCDDYGFNSCPGATKTVDDFLKDKPEKMLALCCGGGFMIKGLKTEG